MFKARFGFALLLSFAGLLSGADALVVTAPAVVGPLQIHSLLTGAFGAYATSVNPPSEDGAYHFPSEHDGKPVTGIRLILFAKGCQFQTVSVGVADAPRQATFVCIPVPMIELPGRVSPPPQNSNDLNFVLDYYVPWEKSFFGLHDGALLSFRIGQTRLTDSGQFSLQVPNFSDDNGPVKLQDSYFSADLRERLTLNHSVALGPPPKLRSGSGFRLAPSTSEELKFTWRP